MSDRETPHPMPLTMRDNVEMTLGDREMAMLDDNARFIVRRLVADSYAKGFFDGRMQQQRESMTDRVSRDTGAS